MPVVFSIPVSRPVRAYLSAIAPDKERPFPATMNSFLGCWLINSMVKKTVRVKEITRQQAVKYGYTENWRFSIPSRRNVVLMPASRVRVFNLMITRFLLFELYKELEEARYSPDPFDIHRVIDKFRTKRGLTDHDMSDDALRKHYQRFRLRSGRLIQEPGFIIGSSLVSDIGHFHFRHTVNHNPFFPMNDLISQFCDLPSGMWDLEFLPRHEIDYWSGNTPIPKYRWYGIRPAKDSFQFSPGTESTVHGAPVTIQSSCLIISDSNEIAAQLEAMENMRFALRVRNYSGKTRIVGRPGEYCELAATALELPETKGVGGWRLTFSGVFTKRPVIVS